MSRIEQALEKAMHMRDSVKRPAADMNGDVKTIDRTAEVTEFQVRESIVDVSQVDKHIVCLTDPQSPASEQYRKLRARILATTHTPADGDLQNTLMVASADVGEGKTITSNNFAIALAQELDHTVLLVDADLRKPSVHTYLGIPAGPGLSEYLLGQVELPDVLINTGIGRLVLLPAGTPPDNPSELLSSHRMKDLVQEMKYRYNDRYIIFDSSPILVSSDALSLSSNVDGILLVVQAAKTPEKVVKKAVSVLKDTPILGVVYNNVPDYLGKSLHPYYYYRYGREAGETKTPGNNGKK